MTIPYTFAGATTAIPLAQLDANFASPITLGNVAMTLSNTYTSIGNLTLTNVTISSGTINSAITQTYGNANAVVFTNSSNVATTSTSLYFDGTNVGINNSSPITSSGTPSLTIGGGGAQTPSIILYSATQQGQISFAKGLTGSDPYDGYLLYSSTNRYLAFATAATERMRLNSTGALVLAGGTVGATGIGIAFPATQSASSDANTLDDYEEGTWTPNQGSGLTVVGAFSPFGRYTKIGNLVTTTVIMSGVTSIALASNGQICTNLPFTSTTSVFSTGALFNNSGSFTIFYDNAGSTSLYNTATAIAATTSIFFSITYQVA